jgi:hypothetical protein
MFGHRTYTKRSRTVKITLQRSTMKKFISRSVTSLALVSMLGVAVPAVAFAGTVKTTTHSSTSITAKGHEALMDTYQAQALAIRHTFKVSVDAARTTLKSAREAATTSAARIAARAAFRTSVSAAVSVRKASFKALGAPPVK